MWAGGLCQPHGMPALFPARYLKAAIELWIQLQIPFCTACQASLFQGRCVPDSNQQRGYRCGPGQQGCSMPVDHRWQRLPFTLWPRQNPPLWMLRNCYRNSCSGHCVRGRARELRVFYHTLTKPIPSGDKALTVLYSLSRAKKVHNRKVAVCKGSRVN